jgi:hypothetical protein
MHQLLVDIKDDSKVDVLLNFLKSLNYINVKELSGNDIIVNDNKDFLLSEQQIELLDKRSKTPIEKCITANNSIKQLKKKYEL